MCSYKKKEFFVSKNKRLAKLMRENNIKVKTKRRFRDSTFQNSKAQPSENILKQNFTTSTENKIWTGDITFIH